MCQRLRSRPRPRWGTSVPQTDPLIWPPFAKSWICHWPCQVARSDARRSSYVRQTRSLNVLSKTCFCHVASVSTRPPMHKEDVNEIVRLLAIVCLRLDFANSTLYGVSKHPHNSSAAVHSEQFRDANGCRIRHIQFVGSHFIACWSRGGSNTRSQCSRFKLVRRRRQTICAI